ncbi:DNA circularization protein [Serratia liquefaciens]|uniref:DNA circularization protein n=1 Tax=Serratia liquefaciens TaxID=614 RepID=UPI0039058F29
MSDIIRQLASLAGTDTLMPASFRGVPFECLYTRDTLARDTVTYSYPWQDGEAVEDQGLKAMNFRLSAFFFGRHWKRDLIALLTAFKTQGPGELVHPIYGPIPRAQFLEAGVEKEAETMDGVSVELVFVEAGTEQALFPAASADRAAESVFTTGNHLLDGAASAFAVGMKKLEQVQEGVQRINTLVAQGEYLLGSVREEIQATTASISNLLDTPTALVSDLKSLLGAFSDGLVLTAGSAISSLPPMMGLLHPGVVVDAGAYGTPEWLTLNAPTPSEPTLTGIVSPARRSFVPGLALTGGSAMSSWQSVTRLADSVLAQPHNFLISRGVTRVDAAFRLPLSRMTGEHPADTALLLRTVRLVTVNELATVATTLLQAERETPALTSTQVERITGDTRAAIAAALSEQRHAMEQQQREAIAQGVTADVRTSTVIIAALQSLAYTLQMQAMTLIQARPPLIRREVVRRCNLTLLAFDWYGDHARADELLRLNPTLSEPNNLQPGVHLYAYAR